MFENSLISEAEFKNVVKDGEALGFQLGVRITYYRGVAFSLVHGFDLTVDGESYGMEEMTFTASGRTYPVTELQYHPTDRWEFVDSAILTVKKPGGLSAGEHTVTLTSYILVAYSTPGRAPEPNLPASRHGPWDSVPAGTYFPKARGTTYTKKMVIG